MISKNGDKSERFKRLAAQRTNEVLKRLRILGNCANKSVYEYSDEEISKIFRVIEMQVKEVKSRFKLTKDRDFKL